MKPCPKCGKATFITSIFGSMCANEECFYEPNPKTAAEYEQMYDGLDPKNL